MAENPMLVRISDRDLTLPDHQEIRGRLVVDPDGQQLGTVDDLLIDEDRRRVRFLEFRSGGFLGIGRDRVLVPVEAVTHIGEEIHVDTTRSHVEGSPGYDPDLTPASPLTDFANVYGYYGITPYWGHGVAHPGRMPL